MIKVAKIKFSLSLFFLVFGLFASQAVLALDYDCGLKNAPWSLATPSTGSFACQKDSAFSKTKYTTIQTIVSGARCPQTNCALCPAGQTCTRLADCETTYKSKGYSCGNDKSSKAGYDCIYYHCPGGGDNVCCRQTPVSTVPVKNPPTDDPGDGERKVNFQVDDCCKSIVPMLPRDPTTGLLAQGAHYTLNDVVQTAINIYECILCLVGALIFIMLVVGATVLIISGGSSEKVALGKKIMVSAVVGGVIALATYLIIYWTIKAVGGNLTSDLRVDPGVEMIK